MTSEFILPPSREELLAEIRRIITSRGGVAITRKQFLAASGISLPDLTRHFPTWTGALAAAAGPSFPRSQVALGNALVPEVLLPSPSPSSPFPIQHPASGIQHRHAPPVTTVPPNPIPLSLSLSTLPPCGDPLDHPAMRNAPRNELGVILLFGILAGPLGFTIESARREFPDCIAKRRLAPGQWQTVRIEFEYESHNFHRHGHDPSGCDVIVCWKDNWPACPKNIEIIALSEKLDHLTPRESAH